MAGATVPVAIPRVGDDRLASAIYFLRRNPRMIVGGAIVLVWLMVAIFSPCGAPYDQIKVIPTDSLSPPGGAHWLGTDDLGRDVLSRVMWGARVSLSVGVISVSTGFFVGSAVGVAA